LLEHAAANMDHPIKKIPADPPFRSRYQFVAWIKKDGGSSLAIKQLF
jgi:hypothetical protein